MPTAADGQIACTKLLSLSSVCVEPTFICSLGVFAAALGRFPTKHSRFLSLCNVRTK